MSGLSTPFSLRSSLVDAYPNSPDSVRESNTVVWHKHSKWYDNEHIVILVSRVRDPPIFHLMTYPFVQVENTLYRVPRHLLRRESTYFEDRLLEDAGKFGDDAGGTMDACPIEVPGVTVFEMDSLLSVWDASPFDNLLDILDISGWAAVLNLSTQWSFDRIRTYAIKLFDTLFVDQDPIDRLDLCFTAKLTQWARPAYDRLCRRKEHLTADEGPKLGWERFAAISRIREQMARGELKPELGTYDYLAEFSEESPTLQPAPASVPSTATRKGKKTKTATVDSRSDILYGSRTPMPVAQSDQIRTPTFVHPSLFGQTAISHNKAPWISSAPDNSRPLAAEVSPAIAAAPDNLEKTSTNAKDVLGGFFAGLDTVSKEEARRAKRLLEEAMDPQKAARKAARKSSKKALEAEIAENLNPVGEASESNADRLRGYVLLGKSI